MSSSLLISRIRSRLARVLHSTARQLVAAPDPRQECGWVPPAMPTWVQEEMRELAALEPELLPPDDSVARFQFYSVPSEPAPGASYFAILDQLSGRSFSHVVMVPWLKPGGADRGTLYHVDAILQCDPAPRVLVIATENAESPWAEKLPDGVEFLELGRLTQGLDFLKQVTVATRLLVQLRPRVLHVINSRVGWETVRRHGLAIRQHSRIFSSLFCDDYTARMVPVGYARDYLRDCYPHLETVFCDNSRYPRIWSRELGIPKGLFTVLPFPYDKEVPAPPSREPDAARRRVLWAGRLDRQKRPDLLCRIAESLPEIDFDVHGAPVMGTADEVVTRLAGLHNVVMHGPFTRLEDLVGENHIAYLHTTAWEGVPTILFDVAAAGLPICAPAVGGIPDFVDERFLVPDFEDVGAFAAQLVLLANSAEERRHRVDTQYASLRNNRSWGRFLVNLRAIAGYVESHDGVGQVNAEPQS